MNLKNISFVTIAALLHAVVAILTAFTEMSRVYPPYQEFYFWVKIAYGVFSLGQVIYFHKRGLSDLSAAILFINMVTYCWIMIWFAPVYEVAYFQCAVGCSFLKLRRAWIFPLIYGVGLLGYFVTYLIQDNMGWTLPPIERADWYLIMAVFFLLSWCIQKYAIGAVQVQQDRLSRFSLIGREATRLTHDIKGLLSSPILVIESLRNKDRRLSLEDYENQMVLLAEDMENVRDVLKSIQRLVSVEDRVSEVDVNETLQGSLKIFSRRLSKVKLTLPEPRIITAHPDRLHSLFFNLILNSIEAFERKSVSDPVIEMSWSENVFVFSDNAGGFESTAKDAPKSSKGWGSGLGLDIVKTDLAKMNANLEVKSEPPRTRIQIRFRNI
ncbi:MAG: HAMP domain-containing histidine kinase [Bdellovibrionales bacterium]|nr:HAMP domain-containing histidine kinase [Bdellovibrionales bacterium]